MNIRVYCISVALLLQGCYSANHFEKKIIKPVLEQKNVTDAQKELDEIYTLLAYSLVFKDWQPYDISRDKRRGYNIGALLVDSLQQPVYAGLNCINSSNDATQHGELRAITSYISKEKCFNLKGFTIYTTLEPCIMCAGMITMTAVKRVVFGQHDVEYSKAFERLSIDTRSIGGFSPYPRQVEAEVTSSGFCAKLDDAYEEFLKTEEEKILAKFLTSETARKIYSDAYTSFIDYKVRYSSNQEAYGNAFQFLNNFNYEQARK